MTQAPDVVEDVAPAVDADGTDESPPSRSCLRPDCDNPLPTSGSGWHFRRYCDEHQPGSKTKPKARKPPKDKKPASVTPPRARPSATRAKSLAKVEQNAAFIAQGLAAVMLMMANQSKNRTLAEDAVDIQQGSADWAKSVRGLAVHEDWLRRLLGGTGAPNERAIAWLMFAISTGTMCVPILVRHKLIPDSVAELTKLASMVPSAEPEPDTSVAA